jgi:hypothetical protein
MLDGRDYVNMQRSLFSLAYTVSSLTAADTDPQPQDHLPRPRAQAQPAESRESSELRAIVNRAGGTPDAPGHRRLNNPRKLILRSASRPLPVGCRLRLTSQISRVILAPHVFRTGKPGKER